MLVPKLVWWLKEWVCCRLWALYLPTIDFLKYLHVDPVEEAMALNPSLRPHWGRFITYSIRLQGYVPRLVDRVIVYNRVLQHQPRFIPCIYNLYRRWLWARRWSNDANAPRTRRRNRIFSPPIQTPVHQGPKEGCVDLHESKRWVKPKHEMRYEKVWLSCYTVHPVSGSRWRQ